MPEKESFAAGTPSWVDLSSTDFARAAEFYSGLFGWDPVPVADPAAGGYALFELGGKPIAGGMPAQGGMPAAWTTYVAVDDADKTTEVARGAGATVLVEPVDVMDAGRLAVFADPAGAVVGVWQAGRHQGAAIVDEPNTFCWAELATRDTAAAREFYPTVFGWTAHESGGEMGSYTEFKLGETSVAGMMDMPSDVPAQVPSFWLAYFAVADADATTASARSLGGGVRVGPMDIPPGRFAILTDPVGAAFGIIRLSPRQA